MTTFIKGDAIEVVYKGHTVEGTVIFASPNGLSLMLGFEALLGGHAGMMPVTMRNDSDGFSIIDGTEITIRRKESRQGGKI